MKTLDFQARFNLQIDFQTFVDNHNMYKYVSMKWGDLRDIVVIHAKYL
jgi:hypothetical protein